LLDPVDHVFLSLFLLFFLLDILLLKISLLKLIPLSDSFIEYFDVFLHLRVLSCKFCCHILNL